jgi:hypothetical protein
LRISPMTGDRKSLFSVCTRVRVWMLARIAMSVSLWLHVLGCGPQRRCPFQRSICSLRTPNPPHHVALLDWKIRPCISRS